MTLQIARFCIFPHNLAPDFPQYVSGKEFKKMKTLTVYNIKCAIVAAIISLGFASQAVAVLRPLFPAKPEPPFNGELIIIGDDFVVGSLQEKNTSYIMGGQAL